MRSVLMSMVVLGAAALIISIVAVSTTNWVQCCLNSDDFLKILLEQHDEMGLAESTAKVAYNLFVGTKTCFSMGLFSASFNVANVHISTKLSDTHWRNQMACLPIVCGMVLLFVTIIFVFKKAMTFPKTNNPSGLYEFRIQTLFYVIATGFILVGMLCITMIDQPAASSPTNFFKGIDSFIADQFTSKLSPSLRNATIAAVKRATPHFGSSFVLGWISTVVLIIGASLSSANLMAKSEQFQYNPMSSILE